MKLRQIQIGFVALFVAGFMLVSGCHAQHDNTANSAGIAAPKSGVQLIDGTAAEKLIASNSNLQILDVRTPEEVAAGVIKGAKPINFYDADFAAKVVRELDKTRPVLVYCKAGGRSAKASEVLNTNGFAEVYDLQGGMTQWEGQGHPVQK